MATLLKGKLLLLKYLSIMLICALAGLVLRPSAISAQEAAPETGKLTVRQKQELVRRAVADYERGDKTKAGKGLERARTVFPENYAIPYYLGLVYLEQGKRAAAVAQWQRYVKMSPRSENSIKIRKYLTVLLLREARDFARQAVTEKAAPGDSQTDDKALAVTSFSNLGSKSLAPLGKGMAAMLIADLSKLPDLKVVDRIKLQALLEEMKLGTSGLVNPKTAPRVGKLLNARHVTSGSLADLEKESLAIASVLVDAHQKSNNSTQEVRGQLKQFYDLEKEIACQIIEDLGRDCKKAPDGFTIIHTKSLPALEWYSRGLDQFDRGHFDKARTMFSKSLGEDPNFDLAEEALMALPTAAMMLIGNSQMISSASSGAPSSATAGSAVSGTSTGGTAAAASAGAAAATITPKTAIAVGAVAVVGGGLALAGGGGGGGGSDDGGSDYVVPDSDTGLSGEWQGTWLNYSDETSDEALFSLTQTGSSISGTVTITGEGCLYQGTLNGSVSGNNVNLTITSGSESVAVNAVHDAASKTLDGTWNYTASASEGCAGDTGHFSATLTGAGDIAW
jgi:TolB-like protein/Tfp pilus assembly protein PilF